jgi:hypothetical protein
MFPPAFPGNNEGIAIEAGQGSQKPLGGGVEVDPLSRRHDTWQALRDFLAIGSISRRIDCES